MFGNNNQNRKLLVLNHAVLVFALLFPLVNLVAQEPKTKPAKKDDSAEKEEKPAKEIESKTEPELKGFKTTSTATKAKIENRRSPGPAQPSYLGVVVESKDSKLFVDVVASGSPAEKAGLKSGDQIKSVNSQVVSGEQEFSSTLEQNAPGSKMKMEIVRGGKTEQLEATLAPVSRPLSRTSRSRTRTAQRGVLGIQVEPSQEPKGTRIQSVSNGSGAAKAGLKVGDIILKIKGVAVSSNLTLVRELAKTRPGDKVNLLVHREKKDIALDVELGGASVPSRSNSTPSVRKGTYRLAVIGIEFPDQKHNEKVSLKDWEASFFSEGSYNTRNATGQRVFGSLNDYYRELSSKQFGVTGKFFDWVQVKKKREEYKQGNRSALLVEAMEKIIERDGKDAFKDYEGVFFLYAGGRVRTQRGGLYWPHRATVTFNRKRWPYFIMQEGGRRMSGISVMCHEFGHMLGLPDLYAKDSRAEGLSVWCAMSNQAGNGRPQHFGAWCKERLGWLKPTVIDPRVKQKLVLSPVERSTTECFKVLLKPDGSEYFLLENRRQFGFDASLPSQGLLIWRVVNNRPVLEESHGIAGPAGPSSYRTSVPFPSRSNSSFTPFTTPSSKSASGGGLPVHITNIKQLPDGRITFYIGYEFQ